MAPKKSLKRPAAADAGASKKVARDQCSEVADALQDAELPKTVLSGLFNKTVLKDCLGVPKEDRHPFQEQVIQMITEVMESIESGMKSKIEAAEKALAESDTAKAAKEAAEKTAEETVTTKKAEAEAAKTAASEAAEAAKAAKAALATATSEQKSGDAELDAAIAKKEKLVSAKDGTYGAFKAGTMEEDKKDAGLIELVALGKEFGMDGTLLTSLPSALKKAPDARGTFDQMVCTTVEQTLDKNIASLAETITSGEPAKAERASKVAAATTASEAAEAESVAKKEASTTATSALKEAEAALKAAVKEVKGHGPLTKELQKSLKADQAALEDFVGGPKEAFTSLLAYTLIVPEEPEAPADAEAPAETAAEPPAAAPTA